MSELLRLARGMCRTPTGSASCSATILGRDGTNPTPAPGSYRTHHRRIGAVVRDLAPTPRARPERHLGVARRHGLRAVRLLADPAAPTANRVQYFENGGSLATVADGWTAVLKHTQGADRAAEAWELYHLGADRSECANLATDRPEKLAEMLELFEAATEIATEAATEAAPRWPVNSRHRCRLHRAHSTEEIHADRSHP